MLVGHGDADGRELPGLLAGAWLVARKDLAIEFRTRTAFFSALVFALLGAHDLLLRVGSQPPSRRSTSRPACCG